MTSELVRLQAYQLVAHRLHESDGVCEIDYSPTRELPRIVSIGDDPGAYVRAWVWVPADEVQCEDIKAAMDLVKDGLEHDPEPDRPFIGEYDAAEIMTIMDGQDDEAFTWDDARAFVNEYGQAAAEAAHASVWSCLHRYIEERKRA